MSIIHRASLTNRLPPEIWLEIFREACADTGLAGRSLASVSRFFASVSQPVKYQSIALHGLRQILASASILTTIPTHLRTVRYLFITKTPLPSSPNMHIAPADMSDSSAEESSGAFWAILTAIAPTIEILHIDFAAYEHHPMPFPSFPRLRDLQSDTRIFEHDLMDTTTDSERGNGSNIPRPCALLPALRHWNITTTPPLHFGMTFFVRLSVLAPSLSHIRVTSGCFIPGPGRIMSNYTRGSPRLLASLPSGIQKLYVKPVTPVAPRRTGSHAYIMRILMDLNAIGDARFVLLSPCVGHRERYTVGEWLERVDGGEGCWSLREQILPGEE